MWFEQNQEVCVATKVQVEEYRQAFGGYQSANTTTMAGVAYGGEPKQTGGLNKLIELSAIESDLIADCMEWGWGLRETTHMVNQLRLSLNRMHVGTSAVYSAYLRMNPVVTSIGALKQGNVDASSAWAKARLGWAQQLATRFGIWSWDADSVVDCPPYLDATCVTALEPSQIVSWDETHKEVKIGGYGVNGSKRQVRFHRDVNGKVDPNGELAATKSFLNMKYTNQAKFCFGCAIVDDGNGGVVGLRCNPFLYSGKWIRTIDEFEQLQQQEIRRVKALEGKGLPWFQGKRTKTDGIFCNDPVTSLIGVGVKKSEKLASLGIHVVNDLKNMCDEDMRAASKLGLGITLCALRQLHMQTLEAQPGAYMDVSIDHKLAVNPYLSLYGSEWKSHIQRSNLMQGSICITDLVEHIIQESAMVMANSKHADDWLFHHDALSQMTCKSTVTWMKQRGYYRRWLLPELGLNQGTAFASRPVGNSPEFMPWDASLNKDVDDCFHRHRVMTQQLDKDDPRKFCSSTPNRLDSAYVRIMDPTLGPHQGCPTSERIIQDVTKCFSNHLLAVINASGTVVQGLGSRSGLRNTVRNGGWGGTSTKSLGLALRWVHDDALEQTNLL
ncbi:hypothetical protein AaE_015483, partial [Aphanomyces astaci]